MNESKYLLFVRKEKFINTDIYMWPLSTGHYFCTASNISIPSLTDLTTLHISPIIINTGTPVTICAYINIHIFEEKYRDVSSNVKYCCVFQKSFISNGLLTLKLNRMVSATIDLSSM